MQRVTRLVFLALVTFAVVSSRVISWLSSRRRRRRLYTGTDGQSHAEDVEVAWPPHSCARSSTSRQWHR
jgi:hypothetical protein